MNVEKFKESIAQGIPSILPPSKTPSDGVPHAPVRKEILTLAEKELALSNKIRSDVIIFFKYSFIFQ